MDGEIAGTTWGMAQVGMVWNVSAGPKRLVIP